MSRKLSLAKVRREFDSAGFILLTDTYTNVDSPLLFKCNNGHTHHICLTALRKGVGCPHCAGNFPYTVEDVRAEFSLVGFTLLETVYTNNKQLLDFECSNGHHHKISFRKFKSGQRCLFCQREKRAKKVKISLTEAREAFLEIKYTPLFTAYSSSHKQLPFICDNGHERRISLKDLKSGYRCSLCVGGIKLSFGEVETRFLKSGYTLLEKEYINNKQPLLYRCTEGHEHSMSLSAVTTGNKCPTCSTDALGDKLKLSLEEVREVFIRESYVPVFTAYEGAHQKLVVKCPQGHKYSTSFNNFHSGRRCRKCSFVGTSRAEIELIEYFKDKGFLVKENTRKIIHPYELDLYFPEQKVAVEYCGLYWHSEISGRKDRRYHYLKRKWCEERGIRLLTVFEDEYLLHPHTVVSRIEHALGSTTHRVYARKCAVKTIETHLACDFLERYHLQKSSTCKVAFGLYHGDALVGVMTGGPLSRSHVGNGRKILEMKRLCFLPGHSVIGGASKLFKYFRGYSEDQGYCAIRSYQDMRYGNPFGSVYNSLGFSLLGESKYTPHYILNHRRYRNQGLRKTPEERKTGKTEWELRKAQGYDRIWDCGHRTYQLELNPPINE